MRVIVISIQLTICLCKQVDRGEEVYGRSSEQSWRKKEGKNDKESFRPLPGSQREVTPRWQFRFFFLVKNKLMVCRSFNPRKIGFVSLSSFRPMVGKSRELVPICSRVSHVGGINLFAPDKCEHLSTALPLMEKSNQ